ncbi:MAG: cytochrome-c oxidase, cbb3-type subunit III [Hyphomicrobiaceae bacterium]
MSNKREIDSVTGVETTGHEWDGVKELNKPLPRWWLLTFYVTIIWAVGYMIAYPAWPTLSGYTKGMLGYSQRSAVAADVKAAIDAQGAMRAKLQATPLGDVRRDPDLLRFAMTAGSSSFQTNCGPCHGRGAQGFVGYPNLNDDDWLWGGSVDDIHKTIQFGIRSGDSRARDSRMPRYGLDKLLTDEQISDVAEFVLSLSKRAKNEPAVARGATVFTEQCANCHAPDGRGKVAEGTPNLTDDLWLFGGSREAILESIRTGRGAIMPAWEGRLDPTTVKALAVYVHSLGGGK